MKIFSKYIFVACACFISLKSFAQEESINWVDKGIYANPLDQEKVIGKYSDFQQYINLIFSNRNDYKENGSNNEFIQRNLEKYDQNSKSSLYLPMPDDDLYNKFEWGTFHDRLVEVLKNRLVKFGNIEIRTQANINAATYLNGAQQEKADKFYNFVYKAIADARGQLNSEKNLNSELNVNAGSNGTSKILRAAYHYWSSENYNTANSSHINNINLIDGRASFDDLNYALRMISGRITIFNIIRDAWGQGSEIANYDATKSYVNYMNSIGYPNVVSILVKPSQFQVLNHDYLMDNNNSGKDIEIDKWNPTKMVTDPSITTTVNKIRERSDGGIDNIISTNQLQQVIDHYVDKKTYIRGFDPALVSMIASNPNFNVLINNIENNKKKEIADIVYELGNTAQIHYSNEHSYDKTQQLAKFYRSNYILDFKNPSREIIPPDISANVKKKPDLFPSPPYPPGGGGGGGANGGRNNGDQPSQLQIHIPESKIGGVMLSSTAEVENASSGSVGNKTFSFIFNGNQPILDIDDYKKFCTSMWAVYFDQSCPGISIDPISFDKSVKVQMVRYIGSVVNTDLGRVMRQADYTMKKWAVGTEQPDISGFKDVDQLMASSHINYFGASRRFWFVPQDMHFTAGSNFLLFTGGKMTLKTEYIFLDNKSEKAEPADIAFADFFTTHYNEIADKYPIYKELFDYAKYVSLANYLKQNKIPLLWFLLANKKLVLTENSPGTVKQLAKGSKYFKGTTIVGGVDLKYPKGQYVYDNVAVNAIKQAITNQTGQSDLGISNKNIQKTNTPISFQYKNDSLTFLNEYALTSGTDFAGNTYQTDLSLWYGNEPALEIVRKSNDRNDSPGEFGGGWQYLIPYKMDVLRKDSVISGNYVFRKYCVIKNEITNSTDTMVFNKKKYDCIGYVPVDSLSNEFILLLPLTDGTFELSDKLGNLYTFNKNGSMTKMVLGNQREEHYLYNTKNMNPQKYHDIPLTIEIGNTTIDTGNYRIHDKIKVRDHINNTEQTFSVHISDGYIRYKPDNIDSTIYEEIKPLTDNKFLLTDRSGGKYYFDATGFLNEKITGYEYKVFYDYFKNGVGNFDNPPYKIIPLSDEKVTIGNLSLPKGIKLIDNLNKKNITFTFSDTSKLIRYFTTDSSSVFSSINFLTNGYLKAVDKMGNTIFLNRTGDFESITPYENNHEFLKTVKQGDYEAEFVYTMLPENIPVVSKIIIYKALERKMVYTVEYSYDDYGNVIKRIVL